MARNSFAGTSADVAENNAGTRLPDLTGKVYDAPVGGNVVTDILHADGSPMPEGLTSDSRGMVPEFLGPDGVERLWVDFNDGRVMLVANNTGVRLEQRTTLIDDGAVMLPGQGRFRVDKLGNATTPGTMTARNVGDSRLFAGAEDPSKRGVQPVAGDVWVQLKHKSAEAPPAGDGVPAAEVQDLRAKVSAVETAVTTAVSRVETLEEDVTALKQTRFGTVDDPAVSARVDALESKTGELQEQLQRSANTAQQAAKANARLDVAEQKIVALEETTGKFTPLPDTVVINRLQDFDTRLKPVEAMVPKLTQLEEKVGNISSAIGPMADSAATLITLEFTVKELQKLMGAVVIPSGGLTVDKSLQQRMGEVETSVLLLMELMQKSQKLPSDQPPADDPSDGASDKGVEDKSATDSEA